MLTIAFFLSGLSAIIYQLIWQRVLAGIYGANIESVTVVVTGFMIGLGAGSLAGGWLADRPCVKGLRVFAAIELGIGLVGLTSIPLFHWVGLLTSGVGIAGLWAVVLALFVVPATLMGATLPVLTAFAARRSQNVGASLAWLYGVNAFGSAAGALVAVLVIVGRLGEQGSVVFAASLNFVAAAIVFAFGAFRAIDPAAGPVTPKHQFAVPSSAPGSPPAPPAGRVALWVTLAFVSGFIALSYELVWYRVYSIALMARAQAFGVLLGGYLAGIAIGAAVAGRICAHVTDCRALARVLGWVLLFGSLVAYLLVPAFAWFVTVSRQWAVAPMLVALASCALGIVFPLTVQASRPALDRAGRRTSHLYAANIAGCALGSLVTGFWLMDHAGMVTITTGLALATAALGGVLLCGRQRAQTFVGPEDRQIRSLLSVAAIVLVIVVGRTVLFTNVYDRLMFRVGYGPEMRFAEVVENRSGVIGIMADGAVYGSGVYDGHYNTDLHQARLNLIHRAYALGLFHPKPRRVLMIGLSSGSWASVIANHPAVESVTVVEINPGYVGLLAHRPVVSNLTGDPRVHIVIDDGRRWLLRHGDERFDVIVANTTYHWRANASSLLSVEFLNLVRRHLAASGVYYFNTTGEPRVQKTAATVFPAAWRVYGMMAVSDAGITPNFDRFREELSAYQLYGQPSLNVGSAADRDLGDLIVGDMAADLEPRDRILARTRDVALITDDNMGTEWKR